MTDERPKELCCDCFAETGRAGRHEDSLYVETPTGERGPLCQSCCDMLTIGPAVAAETTVADHIQNARAMADNLIECPSSEQHLHNIQAVTAQAIRNLCDVVEDLNARMPVRSAPTAAGGDKYLHCIICEAAIDDETTDRNLERCDPCAAAGKTDENGYPDAKSIAENKREREADAAQPSTRPHQEIERLASFIQSLHCGEPSQNQGAVDTAIRMIGTMHSRLHGLARESFDGYSTTSASTEERIDRCMEEFIDWCKRTMPHFQKGPEFEVAKAFDDELREICRRHIGGDRDRHMLGAIKQMILAIEDGEQPVGESDVFVQRFGIAFVRMLKKSIGEEQPIGEGSTDA